MDPFPIIVNFEQCLEGLDSHLPDYGWQFTVPLFGEYDEMNMWTSQCDQTLAFAEAAQWVREYIMERNPFPPELEPRVVWVPYGRTVRWVTQSHLLTE